MGRAEFDEGTPGGAVGDSPETYRSRRDRKRTPDRNERNPLVEMPSTPLFQASSTNVAAALARIGEATGGPISFGPADAGDEATVPVVLVPPVFVLGGGAKDRSLLRSGLGAHANVSVASGSDSDVLVEAARALEASLEGLAQLGYPDQYWYKVVGERFSALAGEKAAVEGKARRVQFLDPGDLPLGSLDRLFPRAFVVRVVGGGWSRAGARSARRAASRLSAGRTMELRAGDLRTGPEGACQAILAFIGEGPAGRPAAG